MENSHRNTFIILCVFLFFSFYSKQIFSSTIEYQSGKSCSKGRDLSNVVVAGGSITETIYYLGHQSKISAVDRTSRYPIEAKKLPSIGYVRNLSVEGVLSLNPSIVIGENDMGPPTVVDKIISMGIDLRIIPEIQTAEGIYKKVKCINSIFPKSKYSQKNIQSLKESIKSLQILRNKNKSNPKKVMVILSIFGSSPIVAGKDTSGNSFIEILNLTNIANNFSGWKAVGIEHITKMNPDVILITKRGSRGYDNPQKLANSQMFKYTNAAKKKKFFILDGLAMLGFGPRTLTLAIDTINLINKHE